VLIPNGDYHLRAGMPVTGTITEQPVSGVMIPVAAFVDDSRTSVYVVSNGVARTRTVAEVKDDGTNAIVTGLPLNSVVVADVSAANVGNGDAVTSKSNPSGAPSAPNSSSSPEPSASP